MKHPTQLPPELAAELVELINLLGLELASKELGFSRETTARLAARIHSLGPTVVVAEQGIPRLRALRASRAALPHHQKRPRR